MIPMEQGLLCCYSFSKEYYANDLGWNVNDTHGTGIVMLAAIEVEKMKESQQEE